jgi:hypothetical protein
MANLFKLLNGEEIIGELVEKKDGCSVIMNPLLLVFEEAGDGGTGIVLINYIPFTLENTIKINQSMIVVEVPLSVIMNNYYEKSVLYCRSYQDKKLKTSLALASNHLDSILEEINKPEKKRHNSKETVVRFLATNVMPTSNSVN